MKIAPLSPEVTEYLKKHNLTKKFNKQLTFLKENPQHPSLHTEILVPKERNIRSFRIDRFYRVLFFYDPEIKMTKILVITKHYK